MFLPKGYYRFQEAAFVYSDDISPHNCFDMVVERLGAALASGELVADGIVTGALAYDYDPAELGEINPIRPEVWRTPRARDAVMGSKIASRAGEATERLYQDGFVLLPIIQETALDTWAAANDARKSSVSLHAAGSPRGVPGLSSGVHAVPAGYVAFDQITRVARGWAKNGKIDPDLMLLLDPPDADSMTLALAGGSLRAFGINKRTGAIVLLPPTVWRMEVDGAPQTIWAISGNDILAGPDGEPCLPVVTRADLARCFQATEIPPDPDELPEGWQAAAPLERPSPVGSGVAGVDSWMRGLAHGYKNNGKTLKREDAIKAATAYLQCTTRRAEAAYEALPYPDLRNPPRSSAA